jgi:DNA processing protein
MSADTSADSSAGTAEPLPHEAYLAALASLDRVGPGRLRWLLTLGGPEQAWRHLLRGGWLSPPARLRIEPKEIAKWYAQVRSLDPAAIWRTCTDGDIGVVSFGAPGYPAALAEDHAAPVVLFHRGDPDVLLAPRVAVIGTRRATGYGLRMAERLGRELAEAGVVVVSGLALGIDAAAHRGALSVQGAAPVAVVGAGLDDPCPSRNRALAEQIAVRGALLSEVPPKVGAAPWRFPVRNRILAALGQVVVVVESAAAGGSMHTVREALSRDRPVLAVPGPVDARTSQGCNLLLSEGAHPCLSTDDVLVALELPTRPVATGAEAGEGLAPTPDPRPSPGPDGAAVLAQLGWRPSTLEQLAAGTGFDFRQLSVALGELESTGWISRSGGWVERVARG